MEGIEKWLILGGYGDRWPTKCLKHRVGSQTSVVVVSRRVGARRPKRKKCVEMAKL